LNRINNVNENDILATKIEGKAGIDGKLVTGEPILAGVIQDIKLPAGKNTYLTNDDKELRSSIKGMAVFVNNKVNVETVYQIKGDVDMQTGNIEFNGSVIIGGSVKAGFKVIASGDIQVQQSVEEHAELYAEGSIMVGGGIIAACINSGNNIMAKFIENSKVYAANEIIISEAILHSEVSAAKLIKLTGKKGVIIGGRLCAGEEVIAKEIGSLLSTLTEIEVGVAPKTREELNKLTVEMEQIKQKFHHVKVALTRLTAPNKELTEEEADLLLEYSRAEELLVERLKDMTARISILSKKISYSKGGKVTVSGYIHSGVRITIGDITDQIREKYENKIFIAEGQAITSLKQ